MTAALSSTAASASATTPTPSSAAEKGEGSGDVGEDSVAVAVNSAELLYSHSAAVTENENVKSPILHHNNSAIAAADSDSAIVVAAAIPTHNDIVVPIPTPPPMLLPVSPSTNTTIISENELSSAVAQVVAMDTTMSSLLLGAEDSNGMGSMDMDMEDHADATTQGLTVSSTPTPISTSSSLERMQSMPAVPRPLPPGWHAQRSRALYPGCVYYFDQTTGICTWESPNLNDHDLPDNNDHLQSPPPPPTTTTLVRHEENKEREGEKPEDHDPSTKASSSSSSPTSSMMMTSSSNRLTKRRPLYDAQENPQPQPQPQPHEEEKEEQEETSSKRSKRSHHHHDLPPQSLEQPPTQTQTQTQSVSQSQSQSHSSSPKQEVRVSHILKKHAQSRRPYSSRDPKTKIVRTMEEARAELQELLGLLWEEQQASDDPHQNHQQLRATFAELARTESDCSSAKKGGDLGFFGRKKMQPAFEAASFALHMNELSEIVETSSGLHLLLRTG